jgi:hypothetical protein
VGYAQRDRCRAREMIRLTPKPRSLSGNTLHATSGWIDPTNAGGALIRRRAPDLGGGPEVVVSPLGCYCRQRWLFRREFHHCGHSLVPFPLAHSGIHGTTQKVSLPVRHAVTIGVPGPDRGFVDNMVAAATQQGVA